MTTDFQTAMQTNTEHGRFERRILTSSCLLQDYADWPGLQQQQVFRLERYACRLASPRAQRCLALLNKLVLVLLPTTRFSFLPDTQRFFNAHLVRALALLL